MMRKSLLLAALGAVMPMYMSDVTAAAAPSAGPAEIPPLTAPVSAGGNSTDNAGISAAVSDAPNAVSDAAAPSLTAEGSATSAAGADTSSPIVASSDAELPLHVRVAHHLEAIFQLTKTEVEAPARSLSQEAVELKAHITETLHKLHNGMSVAEGALVQKLEAILRLL